MALQLSRRLREGALDDDLVALIELYELGGEEAALAELLEQALLALAFSAALRSF